MNEAEIEIALVKHLKGIQPAYPIVWPNPKVPYDGEKPYLIFEMVRVSRTDPAIAGGTVRSRGYLMLTVVADRGKFTTSANRIADTVADHFSYPRRIAGIGGTVTIIKPPEVMNDPGTGRDWRIPVRIDYRAI